MRGAVPRSCLAAVVPSVGNVCHVQSAVATGERVDNVAVLWLQPERRLTGKPRHLVLHFASARVHLDLSNQEVISLVVEEHLHRRLDLEWLSAHLRRAPSHTPHPVGLRVLLPRDAQQPRMVGRTAGRMHAGRNTRRGHGTQDGERTSA